MSHRNLQKSSISALLVMAPLLCACPTTPKPNDNMPRPTAGMCEAVRATPLRLLTRTEYNNTVEDVFQITSKPASVLPREPLAFSFDNNYDVMQVTDSTVLGGLSVAEALAADIVTTQRSILPLSCAAEDTACAKQFVAAMGRRLFRRTLTQDERSLFEKLFGDTLKQPDATFNTGLEWTLAAMLQAPQFLYRFETADGFPGATSAVSMPLSSIEMASKLSFFVWASAPDEALLDAAERGDLLNDAGLLKELRRMQQSPKARRGMANILGQLFRSEEISALEKAKSIYPGFDTALASALQTSLELSLSDMANEDGSLSTLLTSKTLYANDKMGAYVTGMTGAAFRSVAMPEGERSGFLTHPGLLARLSAPDQSSPIRRGIFVLEKLMCQTPKPPPANANTMPPPVDLKDTTRERFQRHVADPSCAECHAQIDPIGFGFENFDGIGARRETDNGKPVNSNGLVFDAKDAALNGTFQNVQQLTARLAASRQVSDCMSSHFFRYALGRVEDDMDSCALKTVQDTFVSSQGNFRQLQQAIVLSASFRTRAVPQ